MEHADVDWHCGDVCSSSSAVSVRRVHFIVEACLPRLTTEACQVTDETTHGQNNAWSKQRMVRTTHGQNNAWSKQRMVRTTHGQNNAWSEQRMVRTTHGQNNAWSEQRMVRTQHG